MRVDDANRIGAYTQSANTRNTGAISATPNVNNQESQSQNTNTRNTGAVSAVPNINDQSNAYQNRANDVLEVARAAAQTARAEEAAARAAAGQTEPSVNIGASVVYESSREISVENTVETGIPNYGMSVSNTATYATTVLDAEYSSSQNLETQNISAEEQTVNEIPTAAEMQAQNTVFLIQQNFQIQANHASVAENTDSFSGAVPQSEDSAGLWSAAQSTPQEQSAALTSQNGFWGVEQTSSRIFDLAESISGGDPDQMEVMRDAITRGFEAAERRLGGQLPEISQQTYEAVMESFNNWGLA